MLPELKYSSLEALAYVLRILGRVGVLKILALLSRKSMEVDKLVRETGLPASTVRKYLTELEKAGLVERVRTENAVIFGVRSFEIVISPERIAEIMEREKMRMTADIIRERGTEIIRRLREIGPLVREGKLSIYDAAEMLGVTYIEAYALLEENGYI